MLEKVDIVAFEGGTLRRLAGQEEHREAVLALPLNRLLTALVHVPKDGDAQALALQALQARNPFPDDALTVGAEVIDETEQGSRILAAALPESAAEDIGEALDAAKLNVVRIDALVLGQLRRVWGQLGDMSAGRRRLVIFVGAECLSVVALDGDQPSSLRALDAASDLKRELTLTLLEAEGFGGAHELAEIAIVSGPAADAAQVEKLRTAAETFGAVRLLSLDDDAGLVGVGERSDDAAALNALPASWREMLDETRFKRKMVKNMAIAGGIWALVMGVLFGVPLAYGFMTDYQKGLSREHKKQYEAVREMKEKTAIVRKYSDHARGALEIMKAISDRLPAGAELASWSYSRDDGVNVSGEAEGANIVYDFKDAVEAMATEGEDGEKIFPIVELGGPNASRNGQKFSLNCQYAKEDEP